MNEAILYISNCEIHWFYQVIYSQIIGMSFQQASMTKIYIDNMHPAEWGNVESSDKTQNNAY